MLGKQCVVSIDQSCVDVRPELQILISVAK